MKKDKTAGDDVLKDLFTRMEVVEPSEGFTDRVMNRIETERILSTELSRPLISRPAWVILGVVFTGLVIYIIYAGQGLPEYISKYINFDYSLNLDIIDRFIEILNSPFSITSPTLSYVLLGVLISSLLFLADRLVSNFRLLKGT